MDLSLFKAKFAQIYVVMDSKEQAINTFATRVRQLILQYEDLRRENMRLRTQCARREERIKALEDKTARVQHDYDTLKMARMMQLTDGDVEDAKKRVNHLIRSVNRCITLLSEKP